MYAFLGAVSAFISDRFEKKNDRGATAVEYGLLVGLMAVAVVAAVLLLGPVLGELFSSAGGAVGDSGVGGSVVAPTTGP